MASDRMGSSGHRARAEVEMQAWIMGIRPQIEGRVELLFEQASSLEKWYLEALEAGEDSGSERRCEPDFRLRVRRCGDAIVRHWYGIAGKGTNGDERPPRKGYSDGAHANEFERSCPVENLLQRTPGCDDALGSEIEDEVIQYRHWAQCIAEMLVNLERLHRLVEIGIRTSGEAKRGLTLTDC